MGKCFVEKKEVSACSLHKVVRLRQGEESPIFGRCRGIYLDQTAHFEMVLALGLCGHSFGPSFICFDLIVLFKFLLFFFVVIILYSLFVSRYLLSTNLFIYRNHRKQQKKGKFDTSSFHRLISYFGTNKIIFRVYFFHTRMC